MYFRADEHKHVGMNGLFSLCRRTASSSMDRSCSMLHASLTPQEMCISMKAWRGISSACVQMGLCSVCRWNIPTWAARLQITRVKKLTRRLDWSLLLHLPTVCHHWSQITNLHIYRKFYRTFIMTCTLWYLCRRPDKFCIPYFVCQTGIVLQIIATWPKIRTYMQVLKYFYCSAGVPTLSKMK